MFTYHTEKNRYGDEHIAVFANGSQIAEIKPSSYYGKNEYIVSATTGNDDRGDYLGRASTIAGAKKKIRDWYSENGTTTPNSTAADLRRPELTEKMTSAMQQDYNSKVETLSEYDFSRYNIETVMREIAAQLSRGVEESILDLFERFSTKYSWYPESENNIHYYNGWATNKAHKVGMKVIIPANGCCADKWRNEKLDTYRVNSLISDLERAMNYLDRGETSFRMPVDRAVRIANMNDMNKADFTYFTCTFYKKGTCHIKFKPEASRIIDRLNIFAGQKKNWLPPTYGKKHYADMTAEEQAVIDDFQGADSYEKTIADPSMLITSGSALVALPGM